MKKLCLSISLPFLAAALLALPAFAAGPDAPEESPAGARDFARDNAGLLREVDDSCKKGTLDLGKLAERLERKPEALSYLFSGRNAPAFVLYRACLGMLPGHGDSCGMLKKLDNPRWQLSPSSGYYPTCSNLVDFGAVVKAAFKKGDAVAACRSWLAKGPRPENATERNCEFLVSAVKGGEDEGFCKRAESRGLITAELAPLCVKALKAKSSERICLVAEATGVIKGKLVAECRIVNVYLDGNPEACPPAADSSSLGYCRERAALLAGMRSSDPKACAASPFCSALNSGKAQGCAPYLTAATKAFCDNRASMAAKEGNKNDEMARAQKQKLEQAKEEFTKAQRAEGKIMADKAAAEIVRKAHQVETEKLRKTEEARKAKEKPQFKPGQRMMIMPADAMKGFKPGDEKNPPPGPQPPDNPPTPQAAPQNP